MHRLTFVRTALPTSRRFISTTARVMAGETGSGSSRYGGERAGDAFTKRERAAEDKFIMEEEKAKLLAIKEKLKSERKHIDELEKHIDDMVASGGGQGEQH